MQGDRVSLGLKLPPKPHPQSQSPGQPGTLKAATLTTHHPTTLPQVAQAQRLKQSGSDKGLEHSLEWGPHPRPPKGSDPAACCHSGPHRNHLDPRRTLGPQFRHLLTPEPCPPTPGRKSERPKVRWEVEGLQGWLERPKPRCRDLAEPWPHCSHIPPLSSQLSKNKTPV